MAEAEILLTEENLSKMLHMHTTRIWVQNLCQKDSFQCKPIESGL